MVRQTTSDIVDKILEFPPRTRVMVLAPVVRNEKGEFRDVVERLSREGFVRARIDGELVEVANGVRVKLDPKERHTIEAVVDRLVIDEKIRVRLSDSVETALRWGSGVLLTLHQLPEARDKETTNRRNDVASGTLSCHGKTLVRLKRATTDFADEEARP